ncbi:hypothetical protein AAHC03_012970 [Spirometra sp. Aus1]
MKLAALVSGGKDSCFAICESIVNGHEIVALVNLKPCTSEASQVEIDSFMFQSVATEGIRFFADAIGIPLFQANITGTAVCQSLSYHQSPEDEVEDLFNLLASVKKQIPDLEGVTSGAILSDYQRERVEQVCQRLHLSSFAFLWRRDQRELLLDMISSKLHAVIVKIAAYGLDIKTCLGANLADFAPRLLSLSEDPICPLNPCGEGGEFETFTFDCPLFRQRIVPTQPPTVIMHSDDAFAPVAYLNYGGLTLQTKDPKEIKTSAQELLAIETEIDVGTGVQLRRPFRSIQQRLSELATEVPQEVSLALISCDSDPSVTTAATTAHPLPSPPGIRPLGGCLFMTQSFTGVSALAPTGGVRASITKAMQRALDSLQRHLVAAGSSMDRVVHLHVVVSANVDLSSQECFSALNQPFEAAFDTPDILRQRLGNVPPSRVCVASQWPEELIRLIQHNEPSPNCEEAEELTPGPENLVIVGVSAVVLHPTTDATSVTVTGMRVRSFSHWAPAAIGPYSQAVRVRVTGMEDAADDDDDCASHPGPHCSVFYAGQIGLIPETGSLPETGEVYSQTGDGEEPYAQQGWLSLRHVHRVLEVSVRFYTQS